MFTPKVKKPPKPKKHNPKVLINTTTVEEPTTPENKSEKEVDHRILLTRTLTTLSNNTFKSDITIKTKSGKIPSHRLILSARSPILKKSIETCSDSTIEIKDFDHATISSMIKYLYSGEVVLDGDNVYSMIAIADAFKVDQLRISAFSFLVKNLDTDTCINMIMTAKSGGFKFDSSELITKCVGFIEKKTQDILESPSWFLLDKDVLISIVQSDLICVDEIELYNSCIKWGKHFCKDQKTFSDLKQVLEGVMDHIRYPLIDAKSLISTVKQDGFMPRNLYIWALEYNASPDSFKFEELPAFKERAKGFFGGTLVTAMYSSNIYKFLQTAKIATASKQWVCLYKATKDGFSAQTFHSMCDNKGETIVVIKSTNGNIFGGYNPVSWTSSNTYSVDSRAFLFSLVSAKGHSPVMFSSIVGKGSYCYGGSGYGPTFGGGHDLYILSDSNINSGSYSNLGYSYGVPGMTYGTTQIQSVMAGSYQFQTSEIEVYRVK
jgi:hypothetical protein